MTIIKWFKRLVIFVLFALILQLFYQINTSSIFGGTVEIEIRGFLRKGNDSLFSGHVQRIELHNNNSITNKPTTISGNISKLTTYTSAEKAMRSIYKPITKLSEMDDKSHKSQEMKTKRFVSSLLTYDNPKTYRGAIVEGWPPWKDRDISKYMNEPFTSIPAQHRLRNKTLIVIVPSLPSKITARQSCRITWGRHANSKTAVLFLLGTQKNLNAKISEEIMKEKDIYGDIIQVDNLIEHYDNLTLKTLYMIKFFLNTELFQPNPPKYLIKIDDDSFVNLPLLYKELTTNRKYSNIKFLMMGRCWCHQPHRVGVFFGNFSNLSKKHKQQIYKSRTSKDGKFVSKWITPRYMYNGDRFPNYLNGPGYVLSRPSAECIFEKAQKMPYFHLEDIFITGFARDACHISPWDHSRFIITERGSFDKDKDIFLSFTEPGYMNKVKTIFANRIST